MAATLALAPLARHWYTYGESGQASGPSRMAYRVREAAPGAYRTMAPLVRLKRRAAHESAGALCSKMARERRAWRTNGFEVTGRWLAY